MSCALPRRLASVSSALWMAPQVGTHHLKINQTTNRTVNTSAAMMQISPIFCERGKSGSNSFLGTKRIGYLRMDSRNSSIAAVSVDKTDAKTARPNSAGKEKTAYPL